MKIHIFLRSVQTCGLLYLFAISLSCGLGKTTACIDPAKISDGPCTLQYDPVCGCDGKTYGNACAAANAGLTSWETGECDGI